MELTTIQQIAFFITLVVMNVCIVQQIRTDKKKRQATDCATWQKYHRHNFVYKLIGIPCCVATGVLLTKVLPIWIA